MTFPVVTFSAAPSTATRPAPSRTPRQMRNAPPISASAEAAESIRREETGINKAREMEIEKELKELDARLKEMEGRLAELKVAKITLTRELLAIHDSQKTAGNAERRRQLLGCERECENRDEFAR